MDPHLTPPQETTADVGDDDYEEEFYDNEFAATHVSGQLLFAEEPRSASGLPSTTQPPNQVSASSRRPIS